MKTLITILATLILTQTASAKGLMNLGNKNPNQAAEYKMKNYYGTFDGGWRGGKFTPDFEIFYMSGREREDNYVNFFNNLKIELSFYAVSDDGNSLKTQTTYTLGNFSKALLSSLDNVRVQQIWNIESCDGQDMQNLTQKDGLETLQTLRNLDFKKYMNCSLISNQRACSETESDFKCGHLTATLNLKDNGHIEIKNTSRQLVNRNYSIYFTPARALDSSKAQIAEDGASKVVGFLKDYGIMLLKTNGSKKADRSLAVKNWLRKNQAGFLASLTQIEENLSETTSLLKLNIVTSINQAYSRVHKIEDQIKLDSSLDEVIGRH